MPSFANTIRLDIEYKHVGWNRTARLKKQLNRAIDAAFKRLPTPLQCAGCVTVLLTGDKQIRVLNRAFRKKDSPTNVLSFPQFNPEDLMLAMRAQTASPGRRRETSGESLYLGDIAMAWQTVKAEAARDGKTVVDHATHLVIHGLLHLFGYDHMRANEAKKMEALEIAIMKDLGLDDPYLTPTKVPVLKSARKKLLLPTRK
ncbi:MAG: rRNA maturation RNase YbeY [Bdellovibrionales bacterium]